MERGTGCKEFQGSFSGSVSGYLMIMVAFIQLCLSKFTELHTKNSELSVHELYL